ncbi:Integrase core domain protein [Tepidimonas charontis]|uniref:Integrase core domain protein n=2 Tax=Tepidimonas charontis TaxID=2267262 RepID=A0A554X170_9BURK|nr:IS21 family transposase [Tepidimonas charontis]TSE29587.1 Integrase core domain protein [Tepidimonas charontis]
MQEPETIQQMLALHTLGWGAKRIAKELEVARNTVKRYVAAGGYVPYQSPVRPGKLAGLEDWLKGQFLQHRGNCDVVRQELARLHGRIVSLRTVERACRPYRAELAARARATLRFETPPGKQMKIDFGVATVEIGGRMSPVHLFVATLGYSRLGYVAAFTHERQSAWFAGMEGAFAHFGGIPREVLMDNARPLVERHNVQSREVVFNERLNAFARHWGFTPKACAPYRPRTKGKDENGVGYVKKNALAGRTFASWDALEAHLAQWQREVADVRTHGSTGEAPRTRFEREERAALAPLNGRPPYAQARELRRIVSSEACVEVDTHRYSVPWRLIGESVSVRVEGEGLSVSHAGKIVARHEVLQGTRGRSIDPAHFDGLVGRAFAPAPRPGPQAPQGMPTPPMAATGGLVRIPLGGELARPLAEYEAITGGAF